MSGLEFEVKQKGNPRKRSRELEKSARPEKRLKLQGNPGPKSSSDKTNLHVMEKASEKLERGGLLAV